MIGFNQVFLGLRYVLYEKRLRQIKLPHVSAVVSELTSLWPSRFSKVKLTWAYLLSSFAHPGLGWEGSLTEYCKDQAGFDEEVLCFLCALWSAGTDCWSPLPCHSQWKSLSSSCTIVVLASYNNSSVILAGIQLNRNNICPCVASIWNQGALHIAVRFPLSCVYKCAYNESAFAQGE